MLSYEYVGSPDLCPRSHFTIPLLFYPEAQSARPRKISDTGKRDRVAQSWDTHITVSVCPSPHSFYNGHKSGHLLFLSGAEGRWQTRETNPNLAICFLSSARLFLPLSVFFVQQTQPSHEPMNTYLTHTQSCLPLCAHTLPGPRSRSKCDYTLLHPLTTALSCNYSGEESACSSEMVLLWHIWGEKTEYLICCHSDH